MIESMSKSQYARHLGVTPARVSQYISAGLPVTEGGKVPLVEADAWLAENVGRSSRDTEPNALLAERVRATKALADTREYDLLVKRGRHVDSAVVGRALGQLPRAQAEDLATRLQVTAEEAVAALQVVANNLAAEIWPSRGNQ